MAGRGKLKFGHNMGADRGFAMTEFGGARLRDRASKIQALRNSRFLTTLARHMKFSE